MARSKPPRDQPWYKVLVHDTEDITYVAERNLVKDSGREPIQHPLLEEYFNEFRDGYYCDTRNVN
ncbi:MAG: heat shock protein HspQ [Acidobacteriota bacterium]